MDDVAVLILAEKPEGIFPLLKDAATIVVDTFAKFGIRVNCAKGKTEVVISFAGKRSKIAETKMWAQPVVAIHFISKAFGPMSISIVETYKHLGGTTHHRNCMTPEVLRRAAETTSAENPIRKSVLRNRLFSNETRLQIATALTLSRLRYNSAIWSQLNAKQYGIFAHKYMSIVRGAYDMLSSGHKHYSDIAAVAKAQALLPDEFLSVERLMYIWRALHKGPMIVVSLIKAGEDVGRSWRSMIMSDIEWLREHCDEKEEFKRAVSVEDVTAFLLAVSKRKWKALIKRVNDTEAK